MWDLVVRQETEIGWSNKARKNAPVHRFGDTLFDSHQRVDGENKVNCFLVHCLESSLRQCPAMIFPRSVPSRHRLVHPPQALLVHSRPPSLLLLILPAEQFVFFTNQCTDVSDKSRL